MTDLDALSRILDQLVSPLGIRGNVGRLAWLLQDASRALPGETHRQWGHWIVEASRNLNLTARFVECDSAALRLLARDGGTFLARVESTGGWAAHSGSGNAGICSAALHGAATEGWKSSPAVLESLSRLPSATARCVVLEGRLIEPDPQESPGPVTPQRRLWRLLAPESGDLAIIVIFALMAGLLSLAAPLAVEALVNTVAFGRLLQPVIVLALILFGFLAFSAALKVMQTYVVEIIQRRLFARVSADLSVRLPHSRHDAMDGSEGRELVNRFFDVVIVQKATSALLLDGISLVLSMLIGMAVLAFYHPWLLGFDFVLLAGLAFTMGVLGRGAVKSSIHESKAKYQLVSWLEDMAGCRTAFRYAGAPGFALARTDEFVHDYLNARRRHFSVLMRQVVFTLAIQAVASTVLLGLGGWLVISGQLSLGQLVAAELIVAVIVGAFARLGKHLENFYDLLAAVDKLGYLTDLPLESSSGVLGLSREAGTPIELHGVASGAPEHGAESHPLSIRFESGSRWAVFDPVGGGQSPFCDLLFGLRPPTEGHLTIGGLSLRDVRIEDLRRCVALARGSEIFSGTIAENVHLGRSEISSAQIHAALDEVGLLEGLRHLPAGLETHLSPDGSPLPPAQRTRLMLARAIAGQPSVLLVDGLLDLLPDEDAEGLLDRIASDRHSWTLLVVTGRTGLRARLPQQVSLEGTGINHPSAETGDAHHA